MAARPRNKKQPKTAKNVSSKRKNRFSSRVRSSQVALGAPPPPQKTSLSSKRSSSPLLWAGWIAFFALVLVLVGLGVWKRHWVVVAMVNNRPVWGYELLGRIDRDFRSAAVDTLVNERIILNEAKKRNAVPTEQEVDKRMSELEKQYGGSQTFDQLIAQQGQTREEVRDSVRLQLAMEKMFGGEVVVSDQDIDNYIKDNKQLLTTTDPAAQRQQAKTALTSEKQKEVFSKHFEELKQSAGVRIF